MADTDNASTVTDPATSTVVDGAAPPASSATSAPSSTPAARTFTQDEVNRIAAEARDAGRRSVANAAPPAGKPAGQAPSDVVDRLDRFEAQNAILRAATRAGVQLTDEQESDLLALYAAQKPEQPGEWFGRKVAAFNLKPAAPPTPNQNPNAAPVVTQSPAPPGAVSTTAPGIVAGAPTGALLDVTRMSTAELDKLGPGGVAKAVAAVLDAGRGASGRPAVPAQANRRTS